MKNHTLGQRDLQTLPSMGTKVALRPAALASSEKKMGLEMFTAFMTNL